MTKKEILKGIEAYKEEQNRIKQAIIDHNGKLNFDEFDEIFGDYKCEFQSDGTTMMKHKQLELLFLSANEEAFILGSLRQLGNWSKWLHLTQLMCLAKILIAKKNKKGIIEYRIR